MVTNQSQIFNASEQPLWIPHLAFEQKRRTEQVSRKPEHLLHAAEAGLLAQLPVQSGLRLLEALIQSYAPRPAPLHSARLQALAESLTDADTTARRTTLGNCTIRRSPGGVTIAPAPPRRTSAPPPPPAPDPARRARELLMDPYAGLLRN